MSGPTRRAARSRLVLAAVAVLGSALVGCAGAPVRSNEPSIVFILTDDQRWDSLDGMPIVRRLLAARGVTFANAFASNPLCCPSRATILTGQYAHSTGVWQNKGPYGGFRAFRQDRSTIATWLRDRGYHTGLFGKYLNRYRGTYVPPGWERWYALAGAVNPYDLYYRYTLNIDGRLEKRGNAPEDYSTNVLADGAVEFIRETPGSLFVFFAPFAPHSPARPDPEDDEIPALQPFRPPSFDEPDVSDKPEWVRNLPRIDAARRMKIDEQRRRSYASLRSVDRAVGRIVEALAESGRLRNTLIVFTSDNGFLFGEHRFANKVVPYEESIRVPLVVRYDRVIRGARVDRRLVVNVDFAPTFADFAGAAAPGVEGMSFLPLLTGAGVPWRTDFLVEHMNLLRVPSLCGVRSERFMYVRYATEEEELYDLENDPYQLENVVRDPRFVDVLRNLRAREKELCNPRPPVTMPAGDADDAGGE